jgi:glycogen(starch) synthase
MQQEIIEAFQLPVDKVHVAPNGVDAAEWTAPPGTPDRGRFGPTIVSWGRIQYEKGFQTLVDALPVLRHRVPGLKAVIAGRGSHLGELESQAQRVGVDHMIDFAGFVPDEDLRRLLHTCSCAVIPSLYEPFGIVALEALASDAPLVAAGTGGLLEVLDGTGAGLLYPPGDVGALAWALERMITEPGLAASCQEAGHRLVTATYSWDAVASATLPVYASVLA